MATLQKLTPDSMPFLHSPGQSSPALVLILTIFLHPPTPAHVETPLAAIVVMLQ